VCPEHVATLTALIAAATAAKGPLRAFFVRPSRLLAPILKKGQ